jgi:hypothetical protein
MHICQIIILEKGAVNRLHPKGLKEGFAGMLCYISQNLCELKKNLDSLQTDPLASGNSFVEKPCEAFP